MRRPNCCLLSSDPPSVSRLPLYSPSCPGHRSLLPKPTTLAVFPDLIRLLGSEFNVVHSYAAIAVERLLSLKDAGQLRYQPADLSALLQPLLQRLFGGFKLPESADNEYLMKAVMRVIGCAPGSSGPGSWPAGCTRQPSTCGSRPPCATILERSWLSPAHVGVRLSHSIQHCVFC